MIPKFCENIFLSKRREFSCNQRATLQSAERTCSSILWLTRTEGVDQSRQRQLANDGGDGGDSCSHLKQVS